MGEKGAIGPYPTPQRCMGRFMEEESIGGGQEPLSFPMVRLTHQPK